jgi:hypothetical protein
MSASLKPAIGQLPADSSIGTFEAMATGIAAAASPWSSGPMITWAPFCWTSLRTAVALKAGVDWSFWTTSLIWWPPAPPWAL